MGQKVGDHEMFMLLMCEVRH